MIKKAAELNRDDFSRYGSVLDLKSAKISSTSENHDYWDGVAEFHPQGTQVCSYFRIKKSLGQPVDEMECHIKTEEILVVLEGDIVVSVALAGDTAGAPDESSIASFLVRQGTGFILKPGIWHALPCTVPSGGSMTFIVFRKNTSYSEDPNAVTDIRFAKLKNPFKIEL